MAAETPSTDLPRKTRRPKGFSVQPNTKKMREIYTALGAVSSALRRHFDPAKASGWDVIRTFQTLQQHTKVVDDLAVLYRNIVTKVNSGDDDE